MNNRQKQIHTIDMIFPLMFIVFLGFCAVSLALSGAHIYQKTTDGLKQNYTVRTAAAYVQEKIREYSSSSQVEVLTENNRTVLALYEPENTGYVTYIYLYKGKLRELFTKKERGIESCPVTTRISGWYCRRQRRISCGCLISSIASPYASSPSSR